MRNGNVFYIVLLLLFLGLLWTWAAQEQGIAQEKPKYVGSEVCSTCHAERAKEWALTVHRKTLFNKEESMKGCEACHGPGGAHVDGGGDKSKIIKMGKLTPEESAAICLKCHKQEHVTLWKGSQHAKSKVTCADCHDPHSPDTAMMAKEVENGKTAVEGLTRALKEAEHMANLAKPDTDEKVAAIEEVSKLKKQAEDLRSKLKSTENIYQRSAEPYLCFNCHKAQQVQSKMPSHHPIMEGKMKCSGCHNPHGGPNGMLNAESVNETCAKCHAEKLGPFTYEHPPVAQDCTICHSPHGSVRNNLLAQAEPFTCLKCHAGPHSRSGSLGNPATLPNYYTECTDCHNQVHGSDKHIALHY